MRRRLIELLPVWITAAVVLAVCLLQSLLARFPSLDFLEGAELFTFDWRARLALEARPPVATNLAAIYIDTDSLDALNSPPLGGLRWPWPRSVFGRVVKELKAQGAKVIGMDLFAFGLDRLLKEDEVEGLSSDEYFARQLAAAGNVVLATTAVELTSRPVNLNPVPDLFRTNAWAIGHDGLRDLSEMNRGMLRKVPAFVDDPNAGQRVWHLGIAMAAKALDLDLQQAMVERNRIVFPARTGARRVLPTDDRHEFYLDWTIGPPVPGANAELVEQRFVLPYTASLLREGGQPGSRDVQGRVVLIGYAATGRSASDWGPTPVAQRTPLFLSHLNVVNSMITGRFIQRASPPFERLLIAALAAVAALLGWRLRVGWGVVAFLAVAALYVALAVWLYVAHRYWLPVIAPLGGALVMGYVCLVTYRAVVERVKASETRYRRLFEAAKDGILILAAETGTILDVNPFLEELLGYPRADLLGKKLWEIGGFKDVTASREVFRELQARDVIRYEHLALHNRAGQLRAVEFVSNVYPVNEQKVIQCHIRDITERTRLESALRESNALNESILGTIPLGMAIVDGQCRVLFLNEKLKTMAAVDPLGQPCYRVFRDDQTQCAGCPVKQEIQLGVTTVLETDRLLGGRVFRVLHTGMMYQGQKAGLEIYEDITEAKQMESALLAAKQAAEAGSRAKTEFLASMSHELRTPLNAILGMAEALTDQILGPLTEPQLKSARTISTSGKYLLALINDILDLSKIEADKLEVAFSPVAVKPVCEASLQFIRQTAHQKRLRVEVNLDARVLTVQADERRLKQILVNLLSNAVKFTPEGGAVGLEVAGDPELKRVRFTVWDTGVGIAPADQARLFQPFVQLDSRLSRQYAGTGLGLALVRRLTELHGGRVTVESAPGQGSRFTAILPWQPAASPAPAAPSTEPLPADPMRIAGSARRDKPVVLLAEDDEANVMVMTAWLAPQGYHIEVAANGNEAVARARQLRPALILMDVQMPGMDGLEATARIRAEPELASIPIIMLTAMAMSGDREHCLAAGADDYLSKPLDMKQLVAAMENHLARRKK
jgi:PAS domain S-box-containing protein